MLEIQEETQLMEDPETPSTGTDSEKPETPPIRQKLRFLSVVVAIFLGLALVGKAIGPRNPKPSALADLNTGPGLQNVDPILIPIVLQLTELQTSLVTDSDCRPCDLKKIRNDVSGQLLSEIDRALGRKVAQSRGATLEPGKLEPVPQSEPLPLAHARGTVVDDFQSVTPHLYRPVDLQRVLVPHTRSTENRKY